MIGLCLTVTIYAADASEEVEFLWKKRKNYEDERVDLMNEDVREGKGTEGKKLIGAADMLFNQSFRQCLLQ